MYSLKNGLFIKMQIATPQEHTLNKEVPGLECVLFPLYYSELLSLWQLKRKTSTWIKHLKL